MSPGMDWRHVGLPAAELLYWSAQVAAHGGQYWATLTGVCDTNTDKRMLGALSQINGMIKKIEEDMDGAVTAAKVLLLCDDKHMFGWADALFRSHVEFDVMTDYQFDAGIIARYPVVIIPKGFAYTPETGGHLEEYVSCGGHLIVEGTSGMELAPVLKLLGIEGTVVCSESMGAAYLRIEEPGKYLREAVGETDLVPLRGKVGFCTAKRDSLVYATWVPPFAPLDVAGAPPERASLPAANTPVPLCIAGNYGKGRVLFLPYEAGKLNYELGMKDFVSLIGAYTKLMLGDTQVVDFHVPQDVMTSVYQKDKFLLIHLINGIGQRPLKETAPCHDLGISLKVPAGTKVKQVSARISERPVACEVKEDRLKISLDYLDVWDMIRIEF
jgi:hypothetical protein